MIKPVDEIPMNPAQKNKGYRDQIRRDLQEAMDNGIRRFEFVGDYKYKYLAQYVREEAERIIRSAFYDLWTKHRAEFGNSKPDFWSVLQKIKYFTVTNIKTEKKDEPRVFCEIEEKALEDVILDAIRQSIRDREAIRRYKEERRGDQMG